jgi:nucleotide-binding universal stress UspA family protein
MMLPLKKILAPTDFSEPSYAALEHAIELASHFDAELFLLHVVPFLPPTSPDLAVAFVAMTDVASDAEQLDEAMRLLQDAAAGRVPAHLRVHYEVKMGHAAKEIACAAADGSFDLLVIAIHGLSGWRHMVFGSVAEVIVRQSHCPVLTVHAAPPVKEAVAKFDETADGMTPVRQEVGLGAESVAAERAAESNQGRLVPC